VAEIHVVSWDWRGQPNVDDLDRYVYNISCTGRPVRIQPVDTGSDQYAVTIADCELTGEQSAEAYRRHEMGEDAND
jgi:hypothetical protein